MFNVQCLQLNVYLWMFAIQCLLGHLCLRWVWSFGGSSELHFCSCGVHFGVLGVPELHFGSSGVHFGSFGGPLSAILETLVIHWATIGGPNGPSPFCSKCWFPLGVFFWIHFGSKHWQKIQSIFWSYFCWILDAFLMTLRMDFCFFGIDLFVKIVNWRKLEK